MSSAPEAPPMRAKAAIRWGRVVAVARARQPRGEGGHGQRDREGGDAGGDAAPELHDGQRGQRHGAEGEAEGAGFEAGAGLDGGGGGGEGAPEDPGHSVA